MQTTVDARGKACPLPIVELAKAVRALSGGDEVRLLATDPAVEPDVRAWCEATGHELLAVGPHGDHYEARVRKVDG